MISLNAEQKVAVGCDENVVVTACPGSGKTRVLTCRVLRGLEELASTKQRVIALTFTNRAADEILSRLDDSDISTDCLWTGTIHAFALEWILRPYAPYASELRNGFSVADEFHSERLLTELKSDAGMRPFDDVDTSWMRNGTGVNNGIAATVFGQYKGCLKADKLLDYDDVLYYAYRLLVDNPEIAETLARIMPLICVDEVQDIQDLQYAILSEIYRSAAPPPALFFVGDADQSIYESLGALTKSPEEIATEFNLPTIEHLNLAGNYRSTQRIINYYRSFRPATAEIVAMADYANDPSLITFHDQSIHKDGLPEHIAELIGNALEEGVLPSDICVIAPRWMHIRALTRALIRHLPDVDFDAPGLSPLHSSRDNIWFKIARLFLTRPEPRLYRTRHRWAKEVIKDVELMGEINAPDVIATPRRMLRSINSITSPENDGLEYLHDAFKQLMKTAGLDLESHVVLGESYNDFFERAQARITSAGGDIPVDIDSLRKLFRRPAGVVINTCHGVKGEEYHTVIAFGLLKGYVPHWNDIINGSRTTAHNHASKMLYVICSRAKRNLHLISESGRQTQSGNPYKTTEQLKAVNFEYD
jgi:superfamily I DNA/RNA helicase